MPTEEPTTTEQAPKAPGVALEQPASAADQHGAAIGVTAAVKKDVDLAMILEGTATPNDIFEAQKATQLGIEARGRGEYDLARKLYNRSLEIDSPVDFIAASANLCDLDRIGGDLQAAHGTADRGIAMAHHLASQHGITLEAATASTEAGGLLPAFWFAYAKVLNFKALTYRAQFDQSGTGDDRDFTLLQKSTALNEQAVEITEAIKHGYRNKAIVDLWADRLESKDPQQWQTAISETDRYLQAGGLAPNREHNFLAIRGQAHLNFGDMKGAAESYLRGYEVSKAADLKREAANDLVRFVAILCMAGRVQDATVYFDELDQRLPDLLAIDKAHQKRFLDKISAHHPMEEASDS